MPPRRVIVVGGGPAGLMAAGQAARSGATTLLLEKMDRPGCKLRISGQGRCNLTNIAPLPDFLAHFRHHGDFLRQAFARFFADDLIAFLESCGVATVAERGGRVFPASGQAPAVVAALTRWVVAGDVTVRTGARVKKLLLEPGRVLGVQLHPAPLAPRRARRTEAPPSGEKLYADAVVLATGGASYPGTGSTGDGYPLAETAGHSIVPIRPALVGLETAGDIARRLQGLSLRNVNIALRVNGRRRTAQLGEMLFTHFGLSGPLVLTLSGMAVDALRAGDSVTVMIDLKPALDEDTLDARLRRDIAAHGKQHLRQLLKGLLPSKLIPVCAELTDLSLDEPCHQMTAPERHRLRAWLKGFRLEVTGHRPLSEAIITAGGVDTREVDPRSLASRLCAGLYFAGELLDVDADTGGYNLQAAFSTGWLAGCAAARACELPDPCPHRGHSATMWSQHPHRQSRL